MKRFYSIVILFFMLMGVSTVEAQISSFKAFRETKGTVTANSKETYVWGPWKQSNTIFSVDISKHIITVKSVSDKSKTEFKIFDRPQKWIVKKNYKYINFECMEPKTLEKYYIRLCEYDSGEYKITVMTPTTATRYQVVYIRDNDDAQLNFDDVDV